MPSPHQDRTAVSRHPSARWRFPHLVIALIVTLAQGWACPAVTAGDGGNGIEGHWRSLGWGLTLEIDAGQVWIGEITDISHLRFGPLPLSGQSLPLGDGTQLRFSREGTQLVATTEDARILLDPRDTLPAATPFTQNNRTSFQVFWQAFAELFSQFDLVDEDWQALRAVYDAEVAAGVSQARLYEIFRELLVILGDRHSYIRRTNPVTDFSPGQGTTSTLWRSQSSAMRGLTEGYLDTPLAQGDDGRVQWSTLNQGQVGYAIINGLGLQLDPTTGEPLSPGPALDTILNQMPDITALILDFRFNQGGRTSNGLALARRLTDRERVGFERLTRTGDVGDFGQVEEITYTMADLTRPDLPVYLLTSNGTASAAEVTAIALSQHERVTLIGERTVGILSGVLDRELPNGWTFGMSHQRIHSALGADYERVGVPPDILISDSITAFNQGADAILEAALDYHADITPTPPGSVSVNSAISGAWYDPAHNGEGWILEILADDRALLYWFTYPPAGAGGSNAWLISVGEVSGDRILFENMIRPVGTSFGAAFDPDQIEPLPWGRVEMRFATCNAGEILYAGPEGYAANRLALVRLGAIDGLGCQQVAPVFAISPWSGSWFDPENDGEGWILQTLPDGRVLLYWFTYDLDGEQMWLTGIGQAQGTELTFPNLFRVSGPRFGPGFDPGAVSLLDWGSLQISFTDCSRGTLSFVSNLPEFGGGDYLLSRITSLRDLPCENPGR